MLVRPAAPHQMRQRGVRVAGHAEEAGHRLRGGREGLGDEPPAPAAERDAKFARRDRELSYQAPVSRAGEIRGRPGP